MRDCYFFASSKRHKEISESVVFHSFWVFCLFLGLFALWCFVWFLFGDCGTLVIVSPFESDNLNRGLMTVRASSAHDMEKKSNCWRVCTVLLP